RLSSAWKATRAPSPQSSPSQGEDDASAPGEGCSRQKDHLVSQYRELAGRLLPLRATGGHGRTPESPDCRTKLKNSGGYILHAVLWECDASSHCCHLPCACRNWPFAASISRCVCWQRRIPRSLSP